MLHSILSTFSVVTEGGSSAASGSAHFSLTCCVNGPDIDTTQEALTRGASLRSCIVLQTSSRQNQTQKTVQANQADHEEHSSSEPNILPHLCKTSARQRLPTTAVNGDYYLAEHILPSSHPVLVTSPQTAGTPDARLSRTQKASPRSLF